MEDLNENILDDNPLDVGADMTSQTGGIQTEERLNTPAGELDGESHSFGDHAQEAVLGVGRGVLGFGQSLYELADFVTGDQFLPDINMRKWAGESKTMTGSMVEGVTQFLTGFVPVAGQLGKAAQLGRAAGGLSKFGKFAKITKAAQQGQKAGLNWKGDMIAGTVADFVSFSAHENRLSNILVEYPELSNPVTEFLKADPDDHELMGRLKNSIEGALTDVAITVAMKGGFLKALDVIKQGKKEVPEGVDPLSVIDISKIDTDAAEIGRVGQENFKSKVFEGDGSTRAEAEVEVPNKIEDTPTSKGDETLDPLKADVDKSKVKVDDDSLETPNSKPTKAELKQQTTTKVSRDMADEHFPKEGFKDVKMQQKALKPSLIPNAGAMNSYMRKVYDNLNLSATRKVSVTLEDIKESAKTAFDGLLDDMERLGLPLDQVFRQQVEGKGNDITLDEMLSYTLANRSIQNVFNEQALMIASEFRKVDAADVTKRTEMMATMKSLVSQSVMVDAANSELIASKAGLLLKSQDKNWSGSLKKVGLDADEVKDMVKAKEFIDKVGDSDEKVWENLIDMMDEFSDRISIEPALVGKMLTKDLLGDGYKFLNRMRMYAMLSGGKTQMSNFFFAMSHHFARRMWQNTGLIFDDPAAAWKLMSNYSSAMFTTDKLTKMAYHKNWWETVTSGTSAFEGAGGMKFNDSGFGEGHSWLERKFLSLPTKMMAATDSMVKSMLYLSNLHRKVILDAHKAKITDPDIIKKNFEDVYKATMLDSGRLNNPYNYQKDAIAKKKASGDWDKMSPTERTIFKNQSISSSRRKLKGVEDADKMQQEAIFQSDKTLHMQTPDKKSIEGRVLNAINAFPASELVIPFKKTPINVITSGLSFAFAPLKGGLALASNLTPKGSLGKQKDFLLRELTSKDPLVKAEAKGKIFASASIWTTMLMLIEDKNDMITGGGPSDYNELRRLEETGWQKYSIKVGGKYYSYQKTDPVATLLGLASDLRDGVRNPSVDSNNLAMAYSAVFMTAIHRNVLEKSFLVGVDQFISSLDDENAMAKYITNFGTSFLPAAIPQGGEIISGDSVQTEAWTFMDSVKRRSSGVFDRGSLDPKRNVLGEEMTHTQLDSAIDQGFDMVANVTQDMNDPLLEEIAGLRHGFSIPSHTVAGGIDLREFDQSNGRTAYDYYRRMQSEVKINGRRMRPALERLINSNRYQNISAYSHPDFKTQRIAEIQKIMRKYRSEALEQTFKEFPEINDMYKQSVSLRRRSRSGADIQSQVEELINTYQ